MGVPSRIDGWIADPETISGDWSFADRLLPTLDRSGFPGGTDVDLQPWCTEVSDQLWLSSCVANAAADAFELCTSLDGHKPEQISRLQIYYNGRSRMSEDGHNNMVKRDEGMYIRAAFDALRILGACPERMWPYAPEKVGKRPPVSTIWYSLKHKLHSFYRILEQPGPGMLEQFHLALRGRHPVVFAIPVTDAFRNAGPNAGAIAPPKPSDKIHGMHAIMAVGTVGENIKIRNSWGHGWGRGGYAVLNSGWFLDQDFVRSPFVPTSGVTFRSK